MKKLSIEEKAKAYDEAIKKAKSLYDYNQPISGANGIIERVFPELKESEDDRIRKAIIEYVDYGQYYGVSKADMIAWLESFKLQNTWKPSAEQIEALEHFVRSIGESGYASPYENNTKLLYSLLEQLKKLMENKL